MSWSPVPVLPVPSKSSHFTAVTLAATENKAGKRFLVLVFRAEAQEAVSWLVVGARVALELGFAEHAGQMRVGEDGEHLVFRTGGRVGTGVPPLMLKLPPLLGRAFVARRPESVRFAVAGEHLVLHLPAWARSVAEPALPVRAQPVTPPSAPAAAKAPAGGGPFHVAPVFKRGARTDV